MWVGGYRHAPAALPLGKRSDTHCIGGWVGPKVLYGRHHHPPTAIKQAGSFSISMTQKGFPNPFASLAETCSYLSVHYATHQQPPPGIEAREFLPANALGR